MKGRYVDACVRQEIKRARAAGRQIDRHYLQHETGLSWNQLERRISDNALALANEARP